MSMADDRLSLPNETESQSGALLPISALPQGNGEWNGAAVKELSAQPAGPELMVYVHAMRRHWLLALAIGLLCAAIVGPAVFFRHWHAVHRLLGSAHIDAKRADHRITTCRWWTAIVLKSTRTPSKNLC